MMRSPVRTDEIAVGVEDMQLLYGVDTEGTVLPMSMCAPMTLTPLRESGSRW